MEVKMTKIQTEITCFVVKINFYATYMLSLNATIVCDFFCRFVTAILK